MNISYFKEFTVLAETKNFWEASDRLFLNQSTLSKHIKAMESELGFPLFTRTTRRVELTEFGLALLPYAQSITKLQFEYSAQLLQVQNHHKGLITIGSIPVLSQYHITNMLLEFQKQQPDSSVRFIEDDSKNLMRYLMDQRCDLIFLRETKSSFERAFLQDELVQRIPYIQDSMVAVLPKHHPLSSEKEISLRDLKNEKFCFLKENTMLYDLCRSACQEANFIPDIVFNSHRLDSILDMVAKGGCVALLMNRHVSCENFANSADPPFSVARIVPVISTQLSLCYLKGKRHSPAVMHFITFFKEQYTGF